MTLSLRFAARSDVGLLRDGNEDSGYAGPRLLAVADGMGGQAAGEVASATVIEELADLDTDVPGSELLDTLASAVDNANDQLGAMMEDNPRLEGMGTTLTALYFSGTRIGIVHVGDSRAYLLRDGDLHQITHDHTFVQTLVDEGRITAEQASHHPHRSLIMRALDGRGRVDLDLSIREVATGDRYLVCSDGLSGVVSHETIEQAMSTALSPDEAADGLVALALRAGAPDNVTCIVAHVVNSGPPPPTVPQVVGAAVDREPARRPTPNGPAGRAAALTAIEDTDDAEDDHDPITGPGRVRRVARRLLFAVLVLAAISALGWFSYSWTQRQFYVGEFEGEVAIFRGLSEPILGVHLSELYEQPVVPLADLPAYDRSQVVDKIEARDLDHAREIVGLLSTKAEDCREAREEASLPPVAPTSTPTTAATSTATGAATPGGTASPSAGLTPTATQTPAATPTASPTPTPAPTELADTCAEIG